MSEVLYYIPEYHCPEYVQGQSVRLQSLPHEILLKIVAYLDPKSDTRALRYVGKLFKETKINFLGDVAKRMLEEQRTHLLKTQFWRCVCTVEDHFHDLEEFVGKQYVCEQEDIEGDEWVSTTMTMPTVTQHDVETFVLTVNAKRRSRRVNCLQRTDTTFQAAASQMTCSTSMIGENLPSD